MEDCFWKNELVLFQLMNLPTFYYCESVKHPPKTGFCAFPEGLACCVIDVFKLTSFGAALSLSVSSALVNIPPTFFTLMCPIYRVMQRTQKIKDWKITLCLFSCKWVLKYLGSRHRSWQEKTVSGGHAPAAASPHQQWFHRELMHCLERFHCRVKVKTKSKGGTLF